jgi:hypothetical protein
MSRNKRILLIIPCILFLLSIALTEKRGPYSFGMHFDPEYAYLMNSLNVLSLENPGHTDHPGTTVQEFGAAVMLVRWLALSTFSGFEPIHFSVAKHPEDYLRSMNIALNIVSCGLLILVSLSLYRRTGSLAPPLALQVTYLAFLQIFIGLTRFTPEPMLVIAALLYLWALLPVLDPGSDTDGNLPKTAILAGMAYTFGCVTKILFVPLGALFLVLPGVRQKLRFAAASVATAIVLMLPIHRQFPRVAEWLWSLLIHDGYYGQGSVGVPSLQLYWDTALRLWHDEPAVYIYAGALGALFLVLLFGVHKRLGPRANVFRMFIFGCLVAYGILIALNAKHYGARYLVSAMAMTPMACALITAWFLRAPADWKMRKVVLAGGCVLTALVLIVSYRRFDDWLKTLEVYRAQTVELRVMADNQGDCLRMCLYRGSFDTCGFHLGNSFSRDRHRYVLKDVYPASLKYSRDGTDYRDRL